MSNNKDTNQQDIIPSTNEQPKEEQSSGTGGLLSPIGDPLGKGLNTVLRPIGAPLEKITEPLGNALGGTTRSALGPLLGHEDERMEIVGGNNKDSYVHKPEKIAGKVQDGDNPLGLDQTGRWGFQEESK